MATAEAHAANPFYDHSYAVVVGIDDYREEHGWPRLNYAVKDAEAVASLLEARGFEVTKLLDARATRAQILATLRDTIGDRISDNDRLVFFFAGHGHTVSRGGKDWGYLIPHGADNEPDYLTVEDLRRHSEMLSVAKHQMFVMDACYGGLFALRGVSVITPDRPRYLEEVTQRKARQVLTAGGADQQVDDSGPDGHSRFAGYFLKSLREGTGDLNGDGWITFSEVQSYVTAAATTPRQTPAHSTLQGHELGEMVFEAPGRPVTPEPGPGSAASGARTLADRGAVLQSVTASTRIDLRIDSLVCRAANDPRGDDEVFVEVDGQLPDGAPYNRRFGTWGDVCVDDDAVPLPVMLWAGELAAFERGIFTVRIREQDERSGPEDLIAFQLDATADGSGELDVRVIGLPVLEDTQRDKGELATTRVTQAVADSRSVLLSAAYERQLPLLGSKPVDYEAAVSW